MAQAHQSSRWGRFVTIGERQIQLRAEPHANRFDQLRLAAAALVIISHCWPLFGRADEPFKAVTGYSTGGTIAVYVFFVISGYLVYQSAERTGSPLAFAIARASRLLPGAIVCALLAAFGLGLVYTTLPLGEYLGHERTWSYVLRNSTMWTVQSDLPGVFGDNVYPRAVNGSLWTLPYELKMYIACGLLVFLVRWRHGALALAMAGLIVSELVYPLFDLPRVRSTFHFADLGYFFFAGACMHVYRDRILLAAPVIAVLAAAILVSLGTPLYPLAEKALIPYATLWLALAVRPGHTIASWPLPDISYGLYIYGFPIQQVVAFHAAREGSFLANMLLALAMSTILAVLSWYGVERPALAWKSRLIERFRSKTAPSTRTVRHN